MELKKFAPDENTCEQKNFEPLQKWMKRRSFMPHEYLHQDASNNYQDFSFNFKIYVNFENRHLYQKNYLIAFVLNG